MPFKALPVSWDIEHVMISISKSIPDDRWDLMFRKLKHTVASPTDEHPAARIWRDSDLTAAISQVRKAHAAELLTNFPSAKAVIKRMLSIGWLQEISVENPASKAASTRLYLLDMEATEEDTPEAWELLQGFTTNGVLCYFSALAFHELTTQIPSFHHIGIPKDPSPRIEPSTIPTTSQPSTAGKKQRDPLGSFVFNFQETPCYTTSRDVSLMPGVQTREIGPRTRLRITTPEQVMLDTLWQPLKCGGQAIAFEAWERGVTRWNPDRMAKHLKSINRHEWERRVGAMLSQIGVIPESGALSDLLETRKQKVKNTSDLTPLPLLNHLPASTLLPEWGVLVP
jgi:hypothetical protein